MTTNKNDDKLKDINYDGIRECDNDLPKWWLWTFYLCIVFAIGYMGYYHFGGPGKTPVEEFEEAQQMERLQAKAADATAKDQIDEKKLDEMAHNPAAMAKGLEVFKAKCVVCHGAQGQGGIGPNFTDKYWIHGGKLAQIAKTIHDGVPEKGMVAWGALMSNEEVMAAAVYVHSLRGTNPPNQKPPQGNLENE